MNTEIIALIINIILNASLALVATAITVVVVPWVKHTLIPWLYDKRLYGIVSCFVAAAEKMADSGQIGKGEKRDYVIKLLEAKGAVIDDEVIAMIESAVTELDIAFSNTVIETEALTDFDEEDECGECDAIQPDCEADCAAECV